VVDRFQSLMNAHVPVPYFITELTGITNAMVRQSPEAAEVMEQAARFVGDVPMVAHNASFDSKFWQAELARLGRACTVPFACTVLLSRRLYPQSPSHKLGTLVDHLALPRAGRAHRALADAEMAASVLGRICHDLQAKHRIPAPDHAFLLALQKCSRAAMPAWLARQSAASLI
jgi:DNA polymerase-3 subunit epsilon